MSTFLQCHASHDSQGINVSGQEELVRGLLVPHARCKAVAHRFTRSWSSLANITNNEAQTRRYDPKEGDHNAF